MKLRQLSGATVLRPDITVKKKNSAPSGCTGPRVFPVVETVRTLGFNEPAPYIGYYAEMIGANDKLLLFRSVDRKRHFVVNRQSWATREVGEQAATLIGLQIDGAVTAGDARLVAAILGIKLGKEVAL